MQNKEQNPRGTSVSLFFHAGISSTADVQGSALCPGSTPGAPLLPSESCRSILGLGVWDRRMEKR